MKLRTRKTIYYAFTAGFVIIGAYLVFITQGLAIDWENLKIVKTGGIYLKYTPSDARVFINKKMQNSSPGIISRGVFIKNLAPKKYNVKITLEGYYDWEKDLEVLPGIVTTESSIKLWRKEQKEVIIASSSIKNFWITGGGIIVKEEKRGLLIGGAPIRGETIVDSNPNTNAVITSDKKGNLFFVDLSSTNSAINIHEIFNSLIKRDAKTSAATKIDRVILHPFSAGKIMIAAQKSLYSLDLKKIQLDKITAASSTENIVSAGSEIFLVDENGNATGINLLIGAETNMKISSTSISKVYATKNGSKFFTINSDGELYLFERGTKVINLVSKNVKKIFLSLDEKKLAIVFNDNTIKIFYLEEEGGDVKTAKGAILPLQLTVDKRGDIWISWVPKFGNYILVFDGENITASEIDSRLPQNTSVLFTKIKGYDITSALYILREDGTLSLVEI